MKERVNKMDKTWNQLVTKIECQGVIETTVVDAIIWWSVTVPTFL